MRTVVQIRREAPAALEQPIEDFVVYAATLNGGVVTDVGAVSDVFGLTPMVMYYSEGAEPEWVEVSNGGIQ